MKKLAILFSLLFVCGIMAASAQSPAPEEKKTETVKSGNDTKAKGCKAGSVKCCAKGKAEAPPAAAPEAEAVAADKKVETPAATTKK